MKRKLVASSRRARGSHSGLRIALIALCAACIGLWTAVPSSADPTAVGAPFDGSATPAGSMVPTKMAVDPATNDVWVIDAAHDAIDRFSSRGVYTGVQIRGSDTTAGSFGFDPSASDAIAVDPSNGDVYVTASFGGNVFKFDSTGAERWEVPAANGFTCGIGFDPRGNLWVGDRFGGASFSGALTELRTADGGPTGSTIEVNNACEFAFNRAGDAVFVASKGDILDKYDLSGTSLAECAASGGVTYDVAIDPLTDDVFAPVQDPGIVRLHQWDGSCSALAAVDFPFRGTTGNLGVAMNGSQRLVYASEPDQGVVQIFALTPTVVPGRAAPVGVTTATLNGTVNPGGGAVTDCHFDVATDAGFTRIVRTVPCVPASLGTGTTPVTVRADVTGLTANTQYHSRLVAANAGGSATSLDVTFRTLAQPAPTPTTGSADGITQTAATVSGTVNPNGSATSCVFQYGTDTSYGSGSVATNDPGAGSGAVAVRASLAGLTAGTTYHFRLSCRSAGGSANGADATFTTAAAPTCATDASLCPPPPPTGCPTDPTRCAAILRLAGNPVARVSGSTATVGITCTGDTGGTCRGSLTFRATVKVRVKRGRRTVVKRKSITVGTASYSLAVGSGGSLRITLSSAAKKALKTGALSASATGLDGKVKIPKAKARRKRKHRK